MKSYPLVNNNILRINFEKKKVFVNPEYQREGDIWTLDKKQLLIDSLLNDYDIPKLYFHVLSEKFKKEKNINSVYEYAIVDGRQRMETIWGFINGDFNLSPDFEYFEDKIVRAGNLSYSELGIKYPELKVKFDSVQLPIVCVETDEIDVIEDMFLRLNEAVSLNAAERRNAIGGFLIRTVSNLSLHEFFKTNVKFSNKRYQHREVAIKLLYFEHTIDEDNKIMDTKKVYLDEFAKKNKVKNKSKIEQYEKNAKETLDSFNKIFNEKDILLRSQSIVPIYYLVFNNLKKKNSNSLFTRDMIEEFRIELSENSKVAAQNIEKADYDLLEFSRLSLQGTNDANSIKERVRILQEYLTNNK